MAYTSEQCMTLMDIAKAAGDDGKWSKEFINIGEKATPEFEHMPHVVCNAVTEHKTSVFLGGSAGQFKAFYEGIKPTKMQRSTITAKTAMMEEESVVDADLIDLNDNKAAFRASEDEAIIDGMVQTYIQNVWYGDKHDDKKFPGFSAYYNYTSDDKKDIGYNVLSCGGTGNKLTSMYMITWGDTTVHGIIPKVKGYSAGVQVRDDTPEKPDRVDDGNGGKYDAYRTVYKLKGGLALRDWRASGRLCNINLEEFGTSEDAKNLVDFLIKLTNRLKGKNKGKTFIYCPPEVLTVLEIQQRHFKNINLTTKDYDGTPVTHFRNYPIFSTDMLMTTEEQVTAG
ncbi:major capsid protein [Lentisphaerota bacterium WC36G]|nr:hypothetical protein LJT99_07555 [Lentisphaerae bacterium WC36]